MDQSHLIKPELSKSYPVIDYGKGIYLYDKDGKRYLDGASGAVTANIGHGVPEVMAAMESQSKKVSFVYRSQFTSEAAEDLADKIADAMPGDLEWCFFVSSGSEATETAMKIAIQHWQEKGRPFKSKIMSRWLSYHGITMGALSMSGHPARRARFAPMLETYPAISPPYCYRCPYGKTPAGCSLECAQELDTELKRNNPESIAAFIAEPIVGAAGGAITPPLEYYRVIKEICDEHEVLLIADEVMTGFGRTGSMLAMEHWGIQPDIVALGKGMGAGYTPIAATVVSQKVMEPMLAGSGQIMSGHTLSANPQSCAAALAVLNYLENNKIIEEVNRKGAYLTDLLNRIKAKHPIIGDIRGKGLLLGMEFVENAEAKIPFSRQANLAARIIELAQESGLLLYPASAGLDGVNGDAIIIAPPLTIKNDEIEELCHIFSKVIDMLEKELNQKSGR